MPSHESESREIWVGLTRAEIAALLSGQDTKTCANARIKLRDARNADREREREDALPRCPDCQIAPDWPDRACPVCESKREQDARDRSIYGAGYEAAMHEAWSPDGSRAAGF